MRPRTVALSVGLLVCLVCAGLLGAQPRTPVPPKSPAPRLDPATLDRRVAEMEAQISKLLGEVQSLRKDLKSAAGPEDRGLVEVSIFKLKHADAADVAKILETLLQAKEDPSLRIASDWRTNSVLVRGSRKHLDTVEAVLTRLDEPGDAEKPARKGGSP